MKKYLRYLAPLLVLAIFILAVYLLYDKLKAYSIAQIRAAIDQIPYTRLFLSFILCIVNYFILIGYDWLALKAIHKTLPMSKVSLVSFVGQTVSYNFGALLGGTSVRFRFYSVWGFSIHEILHLVLMLAVTFWIGAMGLGGIVFLIAPPEFPPELLAKMPLHNVRLLGALLTGIAVLYLILCFFVRKPVHFFGKEFVFPTPKIAIAQVVVSWIDLICAAACMWVLLPSTIGVGYLQFLPGYLMAQVAVVLTHIPGGVGLFELIIIHLTNTNQEQVVFAAVLMFRLIYYILPLLCAAIVLAVYEVRLRRNFIHDAGRWLSVLSPMITACLALAAGAVLLLFSTTPPRWAASSFLTSVSANPVRVHRHYVLVDLRGACSFSLAYGLKRRQRRPYVWICICLVLGILGTFMRGSWIPALMCAVVLGMLYASGRRFYRHSLFMEEHIPAPWLLCAIGLLLPELRARVRTLYHTVWGQNALLSFQGPFNAAWSRALNICIMAIICTFLPLRFYLRKRAVRRRLVAGSGVRHSAGWELTGGAYGIRSSRFFFLCVRHGSTSER